jgi:hypothetical protein
MFYIWFWWMAEIAHYECACPASALHENTDWKKELCKLMNEPCISDMCPIIKRSYYTFDIYNPYFLYAIGATSELPF